MEFYYVAFRHDPQRIIKTVGGKRLAFYYKKQQAILECKKHNDRAVSRGIPEKYCFKVYCVESEPAEVTSDNI